MNDVLVDSVFHESGVVLYAPLFVKECVSFFERCLIPLAKRVRVLIDSLYLDARQNGLYTLRFTCNCECFIKILF